MLLQTVCKRVVGTTPIEAWHDWESVPRKIRPGGYGVIGRSYSTGAKSHRTLRDGPLGGGAVPGASCQTTIAPSFRDFQQALRPQLH
jgi:hypothetical protein